MPVGTISVKLYTAMHLEPHPDRLSAALAELGCAFRPWMSSEVSAASDDPRAPDPGSTSPWPVASDRWRYPVEIPPGTDLQLLADIVADSGCVAGWDSRDPDPPPPDDWRSAIRWVRARRQEEEESP